MDTLTVPDAPPSFSAVEACQLAGVTYRQLDYWARNGQVVPSIAEAGGSGTARRYSSYDVAQLRVLGRLHALGIKPNLARVELPDNLPALIDHLLVELHALAETTHPGRSDHAQTAHRRPT